MTREPSVRIIPTGAANLASVQQAMIRAGGESSLVDSPQSIIEADGIVLPGVGAFGAAMQVLQREQWDKALIERIRLGRPTLCICLGLQLLFETSEESPGVKGLGIIREKISRFPNDVITPHFGWNRVEADTDGIIRTGYAYFANSYRGLSIPEGWEKCTTVYSQPFISAFEHRGLIACQFHPELSGAWGRDLLQRWIATLTVSKETTIC